MDDIWLKVKELAADGNGIVSTKQVERLGISRAVLKKYVEDNRLVRIRKGLYTLHGDLPDEYVALQIRSAKAIFSYGTALYFWGLSDRTPHFIDMTEAFKDMIDDIRVAKQKMDKSENAESLRFYIRYYTDFICPEDMPGDVEEALETFMLRNEASHRYDLREHVNHAILRGCTNYAQEYLDICKSVYDYAEQGNLILKK